MTTLRRVTYSSLDIYKSLYGYFWPFYFFQFCSFFPRHSTRRLWMLPYANINTSLMLQIMSDGRISLVVHYVIFNMIGWLIDWLSHLKTCTWFITSFVTNQSCWRRRNQQPMKRFNLRSFGDGFMLTTPDVCYSRGPTTRHTARPTARHINTDARLLQDFTGNSTVQNVYFNSVCCHFLTRSNV